MSTTAPTSLRLAEPRPLQTFVAPTETCPIPLSILWMPMSINKALLKEQHSDLIWMDILNDYDKSTNPLNALRYFLSKMALQEKRLTSFFLKTAPTDDPLIGLLRYTVSLHEWRSFEDAAVNLLDTNVAINRSPPHEEILEKLLSTGVLGLGTYAGMSIVPEEANPVLLLGCISAGIICISTASGIGRALQDGIYTRLVKWLGGKPEEQTKAGSTTRTRSDRRPRRSP